MDVDLKTRPWTPADISPAPNSRARLPQGREQEGAVEFNPTFHAPFLQGAKQSSSVKNGTCPYKTCVRQLLPCTDVGSYFLKLWQMVLLWAVEVPGPRLYSIALQELSWSGWREGCRCSSLQQLLQTWQLVCPGCRDTSAVWAQLSKAFERCFCFTGNWLSQSLLKDGELSTVETPDELLVYWTL